MNLKGIISNTEFNDLVERIAKLIDKSLNTEVDDLSNIIDCIEKEIEEAYRLQQKENVEVNGGS
jgi:hypothetical protein